MKNLFVKMGISLILALMGTDAAFASNKKCTKQLAAKKSTAVTKAKKTILSEDVAKNWNTNWSAKDQHGFLSDIEFYKYNEKMDAYQYLANNERFFTGIKIIDFGALFKGKELTGPNQLDLNQVHYEPYRKYLEKILNHFRQEVSTEEIEQSEYYKITESPELLDLHLLVSKDKEILGARVFFRQRGAESEEQAGEGQDISWSAYVSYGRDAKPLMDENDEPMDEFYFGWSGW